MISPFEMTDEELEAGLTGIKTDDLRHMLNLCDLNLNSVKPGLRSNIDRQMRAIEHELVRRGFETATVAGGRRHAR